MKQKLFFTYVLTNYANRVLYTGITSNLKRRVYQHKHKTASGFTSQYNVNKLVYYEIHEDAKIAIKREKQIKNLVRRKKIDLINRLNDSWRDLYDDID